MKCINYILVSATFALFSTGALAQIRALLEINPDARMVGMAGNQYGEARNMLIYSNPTSLLYGEEKWNISAVTMIYPKEKDLNDRNMFYGASVSRRLGNHGIHAGFRHQGGLSIPIGEAGNIEPSDWSIDLGYSLRLFDHFAMSGGVSVLHSKVERDATTVAFNLCAYYRNNFNMGINADYVIGISGFNLGPDLDYGKGYTKSKLPRGFGGGGELGMDLNNKNRLNISIAGQYYCLPENSDLLTGNIGAEYDYNGMFFVRGGYKFAEHDYNSFAFGAGVAYKMFRIDVSHQRGTGDNEVNLTQLSFSANF